MSQTLAAASPIQLENFLHLFPAAAIKGAFNLNESTKEAIIRAACANPDLDFISEFTQETFNLCKQHVFVFDTDIDHRQLARVTPIGCEHIQPKEEDLSKKMFLTQVDVSLIVLSDPVRREKLSYIIPFQVELLHSYFVARFVMLEKNFRAALGTDEQVITQKVDHEAELLRSVTVQL